jgi:hypothetical protein
MKPQKQRTIEATGGKFFTIMYKNKLGDQNTYVVRTGVKKGVKGGPNNCPIGAITLYAVSKNGDRTNAGFRSLYLDNIVWMSGKVLEKAYFSAIGFTPATVRA